MNINYSGREWIKYKEKPLESDWSYFLECVSSYSLEFSVFLCFNELSFPWDAFIIIDIANQFPER